MALFLLLVFHRSSSGVPSFGLGLQGEAGMALEIGKIRNLGFAGHGSGL
jgi:hypothetical protein